MTDHTVIFSIAETGATVSATVPTGALLAEAAHLAGVEIGQPCGGQGRCGRCIVQVTEGNVRRRSALRLSTEDMAQGYALVCQSVVESNLQVLIPLQEKVARRMTSDRIEAEVQVPEDYTYPYSQTIRRVDLHLNPPNMDDQTDDWARLQIALRTQADISPVNCSVSLLRRIGVAMREGAWYVTAILDIPVGEPGAAARLIDVWPASGSDDESLWAVAIDIGTTTVSLWLVDLVTGQVKAQVAEYNGQIARGEDVVSRIIYAGKGNGSQELHERVIGTINSLVELACKRVRAVPAQIVKATVVGNSTMIHLLLGFHRLSRRSTIRPLLPPAKWVLIYAPTRQWIACPALRAMSAPI
jgi:uncharacterized 2Fe-2S/4Fe-4S cluster protein (DUF4445 family)